MTIKTINLLGVYIDNISKNDVLKYITHMIMSDQSAIISNVNLHALYLSYKNPWFRQFLNMSQIVFCDGYGVQVGALLTGQKIDYRLTPPDWIDDLCHLINKNNWGLFLLGSKPGIAEHAANLLRQKYPKIDISTFHGYFDSSASENESVLELINQSGAKILLVGMGMPLQEQWINDNHQKLSQVQIIMPVGALFDYVAKKIKRGPKFLTNIGFEWLTRLIIEPKRLWRRYFFGIPVVLYRIIKYHYKKTLP